ncbi:hypothetical protein KEM55_004845, partial [Ascosphaera atra]
VCPHTQDESYASSEESMPEDACMLCDLRDLAHCALVCRSWAEAANSLLYGNVRIDTVHYCELEIYLAKMRKKAAFLDKNAEPIDPPKVRLELLCQTLRNNQDLAHTVRSLRTPYMTREASKALLARTVSVCANLRYLDLPAGFFSDDPSCHVLRTELEARCPDIRNMKYSSGAEATFASQVIRPPTFNGRSGCCWPNLEVLELAGLRLDAPTFRAALSSLPMLTSLKLTDLPWLDDGCLRPLPGFPNFPAVEKLTIVNTPNITWKGLVAALSAAPPGQPQQQQGQTPGVVPRRRQPSTAQRPALRLRELTLENTGILPHTIAHVFRHLPRVVFFSMLQEEVTKPFPLDSGGESIPIPPLFSSTLKTLHYEIMSPPPAVGMSPPSETYYAYLVSSIMAKGFPALTKLYVRDNKFPNALLTAPQPAPCSNPRMSLLPPPGFAAELETAGSRSSLNMAPKPTIDRPLEIYSKGPTELEWNFTAYNPEAAQGARASETRPVSFYGASLGPAWGGEARKSMLVGNGFGGFLAVPLEEGGDLGAPKKRPGSSSGWSVKSERMDMFR